MATHNAPFFRRQAVSEVTEDEREVVATVMHMLRSGRVRLSGTFRNTPIDIFED